MPLLPSFLITFRESFEASLVIGIVYAYLVKSRNQGYNPYLFAGAIAGVLLSLLAAAAFNALAISFEGQAEMLFEGSTMLLASLLVTTMIIWMASQRNLAINIQVKVRKNVQRKYGIGIASLALFAVLREGVEIVLFLNAINFIAQGDMLFGSILGIAFALGIGYLVFRAVLKLNLRRFFSITGALLILMAAGLMMHAAHEFQEAGVLPLLTQEAWNTKPFLDDNAGIGRFVRSIFGYNDNPSLLEVAAYFGYLAVATLLWGWASAGKGGRSYAGA